VAAITKSCDTNEYLTIYYGLNGAAPTTELGTFKTSPRPTILTFNNGLGTEFYRIQLAVKLQRGTTNTNSPELESLIFYYIATPLAVRSWSFQIVATDENSNKIITDLETIKATNTLVVFYPSGDTNKSSFNVKLSQMPLRYSHEEGKQKQGVIQLTVQEIFRG